jgi:hypothetical protein
MQFLEKLSHLFIPRVSNNHKAKVLHPTGLLVIASLLIVFQVLLNSIHKIGPVVLGYASQISVGDVVNLTNQKRAEAGLSALTLNSSLSNGALSKANDMISKDYWAHVAPDGTEPWAFFKSVGYKYKFAGENLARDFSNAPSAVDAWMNSPTHRENILNPKYKEIGIGIVEGDLAGSDTTIIVQFFGASATDVVRQPLAVVPVVQAATSNETAPQPVLTAIPVVTTVVPSPTPEAQVVVTPVEPGEKVLVSPFTTTRNLSFWVVGILLLVFIIDAFLVQRRKISRVAGRTFAHVIFLMMILAIIVLLKSGKII